MVEPWQMRLLLGAKQWQHAGFRPSLWTIKGVVMELSGPGVVMELCSAASFLHWPRQPHWQCIFVLHLVCFGSASLRN